MKSKLVKASAGHYQITGKGGEVYHIEREYGVGTTVRGWVVFRRIGSRWVGTRFSGDTLREVERQMVQAGVVK